MGDINSLLRFRKLPVFLLGNSARKSLISQKVGKRSFVPRLRYPVFFPVTRESHFRDRFAHDCLLQERVRCEPPWVSSCRLTASPESGFETPLGGQEIPALPDRAGACRPNVGNGTDRWWRRSAANSA